MTKRRRKKRYRLKKNIKARFQRVMIILGSLLLIGGLVHTAWMFLPPDYLDAETSDINGIPLYTDYMDEQWRGRTGAKHRIKWLVIHETGNFSAGADAAMHNRYLHSEEQKNTPLSWHYTVDDRQIYHHLPDGEKGYHASDSGTKGGGNDCGIGIEICVNADGDYEKAVDNAAQMAAELLNRYHLDISDVKQHGDFTSKNCPERLREGNNYEMFLDKIKAYM